MAKTYNVYNNLGYWFLFFIVLIAAGFYTTYFSVFMQPKPYLLHVHFSFMAIWVIMVIVQPFLIKFKKNNIHRVIGKLSYFIAPGAMITAFLLMRTNYYLSISNAHADVAAGKSTSTESDILLSAAFSIKITLLYLGWFIIFYSLAVRYRKNVLTHSRYMLSAALLILGPSLDRILFINLYEKYPFRYDMVSFIIQDLVIATLMIQDFRKKKRTRALVWALAIFVVAQTLYFAADKWNVLMRPVSEVVRIIMKPAP